MIIPVVILSALISASLGRQNPPHIVFIVADDLGWNDVGWHNKDIQTPNMNKLAKNGVILDQSYVQPLCTPTRSALMTGYYPFHTGLQHGVIRPFQPNFLPEKFSTLPEQLKVLGYNTHIVGKWHLGYCSLKYTPTHRGFDSFFGFYGGSEDYFNHSRSIGTSGYHYDFRFNDEVFHPPGNKYSSKLFADRVIGIIDGVDPNKQPLYLYIPFQSVHGPLEVPRKYKDMYRHVESTKRQTYCGMVTALDDAVGKIANALETKGFMENALLVFTTDNGGKMYKGGGDNSPLRGGKSTLWEGGTRGVSFVYSKTLLKKTKYVNNRMIHVVDWFPTLLTLAGGKPDSNLDGVNQWKTLSEDTESARDEFIYNIDEIMDYSAIRKGKYKLITGTHDGKFPDVINLFDLQNDPFEKVNIANQNEDIVEQLGKRLEMYRKTSVPFRSVPDNNHLAKTISHTLSPGWC